MSVPLPTTALIAPAAIPAARMASASSTAPRAGFEPAAYSLGGSRSIRLSYRGPGRRIRRPPRRTHGGDDGTRAPGTPHGHQEYLSGRSPTAGDLRASS